MGTEGVWVFRQGLSSFVPAAGAYYMAAMKLFLLQLAHPLQSKTSLTLNPWLIVDLERGMTISYL